MKDAICPYLCHFAGKKILCLASFRLPQQSYRDDSMGQAASDPIGSARQLKDNDLVALWKSQIGPDGKLSVNISTNRDSDGRSALHIASAEGTYRTRS